MGVNHYVYIVKGFYLKDRQTLDKVLAELDDDVYESFRDDNRFLDPDFMCGQTGYFWGEIIRADEDDETFVKPLNLSGNDLPYPPYGSGWIKGVWLVNAFG